jgi:hypothetical protein
MSSQRNQPDSFRFKRAAFYQSLKSKVGLAAAKAAALRSTSTSRSGPGAARTILLLHIISARPSKQPRMVRTFLKVYMEIGSYFLFLQEQIKDIIIIRVVA